MADTTTIQVRPALFFEPNAAPIAAVIVKDPETGEAFFSLAADQVDPLIEGLRLAVVEATKAASEAAALDATGVRLLNLVAEGRA